MSGTTAPMSRRLRAVDHTLRWAAPRIAAVEREVDLLDPFLPEGGVCCDIGAEYGLYTLTFASRVGPRGRVLTFEPLPGPRAFITRTTRLLGARNVEVHGDALGDSERAGQMSLPSRKGLPVHGRAFLADDADGLGPNDEFDRERRLPVHVSTLDATLERAGVDRLDLVKIDVEGFEPAVLRGASASIRRFRPKLMVEIEDRHLRKFGADAVEVVDLMARHGYRMWTVQHDRWEPTEAVTERTRNYLFTPQERPADGT
jgi:FkbM family methyltransferase